jgi:hypothetical protein
VSAEARAFAESVAGAADRLLGAAPAWRPGTVADDRDDAFTAALAALGWHELARDGELAPFAGLAGVELGRRLAPLRDVDALLGGGLACGDLARYAAPGDRIATVGGDRVRVEEVVAAEPVPYGDALGVHRVREARAVGDERVPAAVAAWTAATVGYAAGLGEWALDLALEHVRGRRAFGSTLAALPPVQQRLADAATTTRGLRLLAAGGPGADALAHAGPAVVDVAAACQQVVGAIGFTLEFPLQRAFRRARALHLWADAALDRSAVVEAGAGSAGGSPRLRR